MGHSPTVARFCTCPRFSFPADRHPGLLVELSGHGLVEQHVGREPGIRLIVGAIRTIRSVYMIVSWSGTEVGVPVLVLRLRLIRRVAERDAACVDVQRAGTVFKQVMGEIPVQRFPGEADGFMRGFQLAVPAGPLFGFRGGGREHVPFGFCLAAVRGGYAKPLRIRPAGSVPCRMFHDFGAFRAELPVHEQARIRAVRHAGRVHPVNLVADFEARILDSAGEPVVGAAGGECATCPPGFSTRRISFHRFTSNAMPVESKPRFMKLISYGGSVTTESTLLSGRDEISWRQSPL